MNKRKKRLEQVRQRLLLPELENLDKFVIELKKDFENLKMDSFGSPADNMNNFNNNPYVTKMPIRASLEYRLMRLEEKKYL